MTIKVGYTYRPDGGRTQNFNPEQAMKDQTQQDRGISILL
jgi:hypothetical protein